MKKKHAKIAHITPFTAGNANPRHVGIRKNEKRLEVRQSDYEKTILGKGDYSNYNKPGSLSK